MHVGLTKNINQIAKSKKTLYPFVLWQLTQAADDRGVDDKKFTQSSSEALGEGSTQPFCVASSADSVALWLFPRRPPAPV